MRTLSELQSRLAHYDNAEYFHQENLGNIAWHFSTGENLEVLFIESVPGYGGILYTKMIDQILKRGRLPYHSVFGYRLDSNTVAEKFYRKLGWSQINLGRSIYRDDNTILMWTTWKQLLDRLHIENTHCVDVTDAEFWETRLANLPTALQHQAIWEGLSKLDWDIMWQRHKAALSVAIQDIPVPDGGFRVLDAGCGLGDLLDYIQPIPIKSYLGIDITSSFIKIAQHNHRNNEYAPCFMLGDLERLPFNDNAFDLGIAIQMEDMISGFLNKSAWVHIKTELLRVATHWFFITASSHITYHTKGS